jgi:hypothetical protein
MFDIVSGRETRAAVLLAGFSKGLGLERPIDIDGLRLSNGKPVYTGQRELVFV